MSYVVLFDSTHFFLGDIVASCNHKIMDCGVYAITHLESGKRYIGSSSTLHKRLSGHKNHLRKNVHANAHLQNSWNKYGDNAFGFSTILVCSEENLLFYEQIAMNAYDVCKNGFNIRKSAESNRGIIPSAETRKKISLANKGRSGPMHPPGVLARISAALKGRSVWNKGVPASPELIKKLNASRIGIPVWNKGKPMSDESKKKLGLSKSGKKQGPYKRGNAIKTHCPLGHPYSGDNLYKHPKANRRGCKTCIKAKNRRLS